MEPWEAAPWDAANAALGVGRAAKPCADCPVTWATTMRRQGKCNGVPLDEPGEGATARNEGEPPLSHASASCTHGGR